MATTYTFSPIGRCIYCGSTSQLGEEHIIPFSLNGGMVLPEASCDVCETAINTYENLVARKIFGHFRVRFEVQTRNKKDRKRYLKTPLEIGTVNADGKEGIAHIPPLDHPVMLFTCKFDTAKMLLGIPQDNNDFKWTGVSWSNNKELDELVTKYHWNRKVRVQFYPHETARLIAKIGYSYAVAEFGIDAFRPLPITLDTILCRTENVSYSVGGNWELPALDPNGKHVLNIGLRPNGDSPQLIIEVWLFPAFGLPKYHVVVGEFDLQNPTQASAFEKILARSEVRT